MPSSPPPPMFEVISGSRAKFVATGLTTAVVLYFLASSHPARRADTYGYPPPLSITSTTSPSVTYLPPVLDSDRIIPITPSPASDLYPDQRTLQANLRESFSAILRRPIPSHGEALVRQSRICRHLRDQTSSTQINEDFHWWETVLEVELRAGRDAVVHKVAETLGLSGVGGKEYMEVGDTAWKELFGDGRRGIVYAGGHGDTIKKILSSLTILRNHWEFVLPVEIWAFPSELQALHPQLRQQIEALGDVTFRTSSTTTDGGGRHYEIKGEAIARSSFSEVLFLDSDNGPPHFVLVNAPIQSIDVPLHEVPARDPTFVFESPLYQRHGMVLWVDYGRDSSANPIWRLTGKDCDPEAFSAETGQVLVNKRAQGGVVLAALLAAQTMQQKRKFWYRLSQGDKDTFPYAFYLLGAPFAWAPHYVAAAGSELTTDFQGHTHCGNTMLQFGLSPREWELPEVRKLVRADYEPPTDHAPPLFVHANLLKYSGSYHRGNTFETIKHVTVDLLQDSPTDVMDRIRFDVYHHRGLCVDIWDSSTTPQDSQTMTTVPWKEAWGGMLEKFEDLFFDNDGIPG